MLRLILPILSLYALTATAQQQTGAPAGIPMPDPPSSTNTAVSANRGPEALAFRVKIVDGRTGAAVQGSHVKLWYDEPAGPGYEFATDDHGSGLMPAPVGEPVRVLATITDSVDCRKPEKGTPPEGYNLAAIAKSGMQGQNTCGHLAVRTQPGELVLYVRSAHWYEGINRPPRE